MMLHQPPALSYQTHDSGDASPPQQHQAASPFSHGPEGVEPPASPHRLADSVRQPTDSRERHAETTPAADGTQQRSSPMRVPSGAPAEPEPVEDTGRALRRSTRRVVPRRRLSPQLRGKSHHVSSAP